MVQADKLGQLILLEVTRDGIADHLVQLLE
jgi:hypothetical protein